MAAPDPDRMTRGARHAFIVLAAALLLVMAASPVFTVVYANSTARVQDKTIARLNAAIAELRAQQLAGCAFDADVGGIPLQSSPRPSKLGVSIVVDSRAKWRALHCPGSLPPPSPGLAHWAAYYHLPGR